jgi:hypothetical protein
MQKHHKRKTPIEIRAAAKRLIKKHDADFAAWVQSVESDFLMFSKIHQRLESNETAHEDITDYLQEREVSRWQQ